MLPAPAAQPTTLDLFGQQYTLVETNAPAAYDYSAIPLVGGDVSNGSTRVILLPTDMLPSQLARYSSGLYQGVVSDLYDRDTVVDTLYNRLTHPNA